MDLNANREDLVEQWREEKSLCLSQSWGLRTEGFVEGLQCHMDLVVR